MYKKKFLRTLVITWLNPRVIVCSCLVSLNAMNADQIVVAGEPLLSTQDARNMVRAIRDAKIAPPASARRRIADAIVVLAQAVESEWDANTTTREDLTRLVARALPMLEQNDLLDLAGAFHRIGALPIAQMLLEDLMRSLRNGTSRHRIVEWSWVIDECIKAQLADLGREACARALKKPDGPFNNHARLQILRGRLGE